MSAMIGILVDVSGSMRRSIGGPVNQQGGSWARSIFKVTDELIKQDVLPGNQVFAIGYGADKQPHIFDLLSTVQNVPRHQSNRETGSKEHMLKETLNILERNGAPYVRYWVEMSILNNAVCEEEAPLFLAMLEDNESFRSQFVNDCLPMDCRERYSDIGCSGTFFLSKIATLATGGSVGKATEVSVRKAIEEGLSLMWKVNAVTVSPSAIISVHKASDILHGCIKSYTDASIDKLTDEQIDKLMRIVDPFIYGRTPMIAALNNARNLLSMPQFGDHKKVLFVLSDGQPTDGGSPPDLSSLDVHVVCCYITDSPISDPKHLYSTECQQWDDGAKFMFRISSAISTQLLPRTIFVRRGWNVDITNNETKLFLQVNHPDLIAEVCSFARDVVCSQDALSDLLASVELDLYINKANQGFGAKRQVGGTCYANAAAAVLHLAMKRIVERNGGYPDFFALRKEMIDLYGEHGAATRIVLKEICPRYRLHCNEIEVKDALKAITAKRPVLTTFRLTDEEWELFSAFYERYPAGVLTKREIDIGKRSSGASLGGHAVVLTSFNSGGLTLMNSWGTKWANNGFFSVQNAEVLDLKFIDVYWTLNDLYPSEIASYDREGPSIAKKLITSLKGLSTATFRCPLCRQVSKVTEFTGKLVHAACPKCKRVFNTNSQDAHDLVLNMYLTSLCRA